METEIRNKKDERRWKNRNKNSFPFFLFLISYFLFLISYFLFPPIASAQQLVGLQESDISLEMIPQNPSPNQTVYMTLDSFATDLNSADITWSVDGKKTLQGKGKKRLSVVAKNLGQKTTVRITINTQGGILLKEITIIPSSVDMVWEANTYTPPFFKGRPLFSPEANITFIAIPHIIRNNTEISPKNLIYTWSNGGTVLGDNSGYGLNSITIQGSILPRPMDITVEVTDPVSNATAFGQTTVEAETPFVLFYKNDPLYGVQYEKALQGSYDMKNNEINITAVPYYFSTQSKNNNTMTYTWQINGVPISDGLNSAQKVFRRIGNVFGSSNISVSVAQGDTIFQTAKQSFTINFRK